MASNFSSPDGKLPPAAPNHWQQPQQQPPATPAGAFSPQPQMAAFSSPQSQPNFGQPPPPAFFSPQPQPNFGHQPPPAFSSPQPQPNFGHQPPPAFSLPQPSFGQQQPQAFPTTPATLKSPPDQKMPAVFTVGSNAGALFMSPLTQKLENNNHIQKQLQAIANAYYGGMKTKDRPLTTYQFAHNNKTYRRPMTGYTCSKTSDNSLDYGVSVLIDQTNQMIYVFRHNRVAIPTGPGEDKAIEHIGDHLAVHNIIEFEKLHGQVHQQTESVEAIVEEARKLGAVSPGKCFIALFFAVKVTSVRSATLQNGTVTFEQHIIFRTRQLVTALRRNDPNNELVQVYHRWKKDHEDRAAELAGTDDDDDDDDDDAAAHNAQSLELHLKQTEGRAAVDKMHHEERTAKDKMHHAERTTKDKQHYEERTAKDKQHYEERKQHHEERTAKDKQHHEERKAHAAHEAAREERESKERMAREQREAERERREAERAKREAERAHERELKLYEVFSPGKRSRDSFDGEGCGNSGPSQKQRRTIKACKPSKAELSEPSDITNTNAPAGHNNNNDDDDKSSTDSFADGGVPAPIGGTFVDNVYVPAGMMVLPVDGKPVLYEEKDDDFK